MQSCQLFVYQHLIFLWLFVFQLKFLHLQEYLEKAKADISRLEQALVMFKINEGTYPSQSQGLDSLKSNPGDLKKPFLYPAGGYINKLPKDPWGNDYVYVFPTNNGSYQIISLGADGQPGGEGESKDITNTP